MTERQGEAGGSRLEADKAGVCNDAPNVKSISVHLSYHPLSCERLSYALSPSRQILVACREPFPVALLKVEKGDLVSVLPLLPGWGLIFCQKGPEVGRCPVRSAVSERVIGQKGLASSVGAAVLIQYRTTANVAPCLSTAQILVAHRSVVEWLTSDAAGDFKINAEAGHLAISRHISDDPCIKEGYPRCEFKPGWWPFLSHVLSLFISE